MSCNNNEVFPTLHYSPCAGILQGGGDGSETTEGAAGIVSGEDGRGVERDEMDRRCRPEGKESGDRLLRVQPPPSESFERCYQN